jgi:membrane dipeptidase
MIERNPADVHADSIVIDAVSPLVKEHPEYIEWYRAGGVTALAPTIASTENAQIALTRLATWHRLLRERQDLLLVRRTQDIALARQSGRMGIYFHFQGTDPIENNLDLIDLYKTLGVGMVQLSYNVKNRVGDGCEERTDAGLSRFGIRLIERLNKTRVIVDCSHTGLRTSMDAIEHSAAPVVLSHSNAASVHATARNASNELIDAIAKSGGVIGAVGFPAMIGASTAPSLDDFVAHIDAIVERVGIDHIGLGLDYYIGQAGITSDEEASALYRRMVTSGTWHSAYPPPPHHYPAGIETPKTLPALTSRLLQKGYNENEVRKILGENWLRVMRQVWDA